VLSDRELNWQHCQAYNYFLSQIGGQKLLAVFAWAPGVLERDPGLRLLDLGFQNW